MSNPMFFLENTISPQFLKSLKCDFTNLNRIMNSTNIYGLQHISDDLSIDEKAILRPVDIENSPSFVRHFQNLQKMNPKDEIIAQKTIERYFDSKFYVPSPYIKSYNVISSKDSGTQTMVSINPNAQTAHLFDSFILSDAILEECMKSFDYKLSHVLFTSIDNKGMDSSFLSLRRKLFTPNHQNKVKFDLINTPNLRAPGPQENIIDLNSNEMEIYERLCEEDQLPLLHHDRQSDSNPWADPKSCSCCKRGKRFTTPINFRPIITPTSSSLRGLTAFPQNSSSSPLLLPKHNGRRIHRSTLSAHRLVREGGTATPPFPESGKSNGSGRVITRNDSTSKKWNFPSPPSFFLRDHGSPACSPIKEESPSKPSSFERHHAEAILTRNANLYPKDENIEDTSLSVTDAEENPPSNCSGDISALQNFSSLSVSLEDEENGPHVERTDNQRLEDASDHRKISISPHISFMDQDSCNSNHNLSHSGLLTRSNSLQDKIRRNFNISNQNSESHMSIECISPIDEKNIHGLIKKLISPEPNICKARRRSTLNIKLSGPKSDYDDNVPTITSTNPTGKKHVFFELSTIREISFNNNRLIATDEKTDLEDKDKPSSYDISCRNDFNNSNHHKDPLKTHENSCSINDDFVLEGGPSMNVGNFSFFRPSPVGCGDNLDSLGNVTLSPRLVHHRQRFNLCSTRRSSAGINSGLLPTPSHLKSKNVDNSNSTSTADGSRSNYRLNHGFNMEMNELNNSHNNNNNDGRTLQTFLFQTDTGYGSYSTNRTTLSPQQRINEPLLLIPNSSTPVDILLNTPPRNPNLLTMNNQRNIPDGTDEQLQCSGNGFTSLTDQNNFNNTQSMASSSQNFTNSSRIFGNSNAVSQQQQQPQRKEWLPRSWSTPQMPHK